MHHLDFIVWMTVYPLADAAARWLYEDVSISDSKRLYADLLQVILYFGVAIALW